MALWPPKQAIFFRSRTACSNSSDMLEAAGGGGLAANASLSSPLSSPNPTKTRCNSRECTADIGGGGGGGIDPIAYDEVTESADTVDARSEPEDNDCSSRAARRPRFWWPFSAPL